MKKLLFLLSKLTFIFLFVFISFNLSAAVNIEITEENVDSGFVNLGNCEIILKNRNKIKGTVKMRFNYPVFGKNFFNKKFILKEGKEKKELTLSEISEIWLEKVIYPHKGIVMMKTKNGKDYTLKHFVVSREPIQIESDSRGVLNLRFHLIKTIKLINN